MGSVAVVVEGAIRGETYAATSSAGTPLRDKLTRDAAN
jgi:hypothetical protein